MFRRIVAATSTAAIASAGLALVVPTGAGAQSSDYLGDTVSGNFFGDARDEIFDYWVGSNPETPDALAWFEAPDDYPTTGPSIQTHTQVVSGAYIPVVGDFDGDHYDEILWYAPGPTKDYVWNFNADHSHTSRLYPVNGNYWPVVGDYTGDGTDDILWYAAGKAQDYLWDYNAGGSYVSTPRTINGYYQPISGSFGKDNTDDLIWYAPGSTADFLWDFNVGSFNYVNKGYPINGTYLPIVFDIDNDGWRGDDILWYSPGAGTDFLWNFKLGVKGNTSYNTFGLNDFPIAGDYLGDGHDDIYWYNSQALFEHSDDGTRHDWSFSIESAAAGKTASGTTEREASSLGDLAVDKAVEASKLD